MASKPSLNYVAAKYVAANYTIIKKTAVVPDILLLNTICIKYYVN